MRNINLNKLIYPLKVKGPEIFLKNMTSDSRNVKVGDLFVAVSGHVTDGHNYILQAINKGSYAIIKETKQNKDGKIYKIYNIPVICIYKLKEKLSMLAGYFYGHPSFYLKLIGVTGTNGKTTITHILAQWANLMNDLSAVMGTIGNGIINSLKQSNNTTESAIEIQRYLFNLLKKNVILTAIEVSSHGLVQNRINGLYFSAAIFTNFSQDHLDYHKNMVQYKISKWRFFNDINVNYRIINIDDYTGLSWIYKLPLSTTVIVSSQIIKNKFLNNNWLYAIKTDCNIKLNITKIDFCSSWGNGTIYSNLIGKFNVINLLLALATLLVLGYPLSLLISSSSKLKPICGRMEFFNKEGLPSILIDYAHNPESLKQSLISARQYCYGKLWCVFGCGGERDKSKRRIMGSIAETYADKIIITNDNPRNEPSQQIVDDIMSGIIHKDRVEVILERKEAIVKAIKKSNLTDLVLISGKGHENYQIINNQTIKYSDYEVISNLSGI